MDAKGGIIRYILKGQMDKDGHYDVEIEGWMESFHYNVQIKRADG